MPTQQTFRLILASGSAARRALLTKAGYDFEVRPSHIDEPMDLAYPDVRTLVQHVSWLKARAVAPSVNSGIVLAADTVGWIDGHAIGKPTDADDARRILRTLAGRQHELWTGVCLWKQPGDWQIAWQESSIVAVKPLTDQEIETYLATRTWRECSGAYAIMESNDPYVHVVEGSTSNVIGLPLESLASGLRLLGG